MNKHQYIHIMEFYVCNKRNVRYIDIYYIFINSENFFSNVEENYGYIVLFKLKIQTIICVLFMESYINRFL